MQNYQHLLLAIDYSTETCAIAEKAKALAFCYHAKLSIIHILDNIPMPDTPYGAVIPLSIPVDNVLLEEERLKFNQLCDKLDIEFNQRWLIWGVPKQAITEFASQQQIDLIVTGSHARHGLGLLIGSTANSVLHHAVCDILAVRISD